MMPDSNPRRPGLFGLILCGLLLDVTIGTSPTEAQRLYWTVRDTDEIRRTCLDGSNTHVLDIPQVSSPSAIAVDSAGGKIYWNGDGIFRANLDGTQPEAIIDSTAEAIAIDSAANKVYWIYPGPDGGVWRASLNGSGKREIVSGLYYPHEIALDVVGGKMYWTIGRSIQRADLSGLNVETVVTAYIPFSIVLNVEAGHMYWTDLNAGRGIMRASLDGSNIEQIVAGSSSERFRHLALDPAAEKLYYTVFDYSTPIREIVWVDLDGSNKTTLLTSTGHVFASGMALDLNPCGGPDCDGNGNPDDCDLCYGSAVDCNANGVPDDCDLNEGTSPDCNNNSVPDVCDVEGGASEDCDGNLVPDECEDTTADCNNNGEWDPCDLFYEMSADCNGNDYPDECDVSEGASQDCNGNGTPDECIELEVDCNENLYPDFCDIDAGTSGDCNGNGTPDECEPDCNLNGVPDSCDIDAGTTGDCNSNGIPDECIELEVDCNDNLYPDYCDIDAGTSGDCNDNGIPDECIELEVDCNGNLVPDFCDIAAGTSEDVNVDGRPDECAPSFCGRPEFSWVPVGASAPFTTTQPDCRGEHTVIILPAGTTGQIVEFEVRLSGWGSINPWLGAAQASLDASGLLGINANPSQPGLDLTLLNNQPWRDNPGGNGIFDGAFMVTQTCDDLIGGTDLGIPCGSIPAIIDWSPCGANPGTGNPTFCTPNPDFVFSTNLTVGAVVTQVPNIVWAGVPTAGVNTADDGVSSYYLGTLVLNVPADFVGTYTFGFDPSQNSTFMFLHGIFGLLRTPGHVTLQDGACCTTQPGGGTPTCTDGVYQEDCQGLTDIYVAGKDCDDAGFTCPSCAVDAHCQDGVFCNGVETCDVSAGACLPATSPCTPPESCDEQSRICRAGGACCDRANGTCVANEIFTNCLPPLTFQEGVFFCVDLPDSDGDGLPDCLDQCPGGDDAVFAPECEAAIPTVSGWGMVVLTLLLLVLGKVYFRRSHVSIGRAPSDALGLQHE